MKTILITIIISLTPILASAQSKTQVILDVFAQKLAPITESTQESQNPPESPTVEPTTTIITAPLSAGEMKVQEMLRKNRERLKQVRQEQNSQPSGSKDDPASQARERYEKKAKDRRDNYTQKAQQLRAQWQRKKEGFLKRIPEYKKQTFDLKDLISLGSSPQARTKVVVREAKKLKVRGQDLDETIIQGALELQVKDQGPRPTCAAFAGVRALEILDQKRPQKSDRQFSEQFFYYASKPRCQRSPCSDKGSWVTNAFEYFKQNPIPDELSCPYKSSSISGNQTHLPLPGTCFKGEPLNLSYRNLSSLSEVSGEIAQGHPVIVGVRLTPNFYSTDAIVYEASKNIGGDLDSHAQGHALVIVGVIPLPSSDRLKEGNHCYIVANSWGEGWGAGGHACLSQRWLENQLVAGAIVSLENI